MICTRADPCLNYLRYSNCSTAGNAIDSGSHAPDRRCSRTAGQPQPPDCSCAGSPAPCAEGRRHTSYGTRRRNFQHALHSRPQTQVERRWSLELLVHHLALRCVWSSVGVRVLVLRLLPDGVAPLGLGVGWWAVLRHGRGAELRGDQRTELAGRVRRRREFDLDVGVGLGRESRRQLGGPVLDDRLLGKHAARRDGWVRDVARTGCCRGR